MTEHTWVIKTIVQVSLLWLALLTITQFLGFIFMTKSRDELDAQITDLETKFAAEQTASQALRDAVSALLAKLPASADYQAEVDRLAALGVTADSDAAADTQAATDVSAAG